jgi:hypothetical protein
MPLGVFAIGSAKSVITLVFGLISYRYLIRLPLMSQQNVQAMAIEKLTKKRYMSSFHGMWSVGAFVVTMIWRPSG